MKNKRPFCPPLTNPLVLGAVKLMLPFLFRGGSFEINNVVFRPDDLARLKSLQHQRMVLLPNHPSGNDPLVMFELSRQLGESFNYVAAREVFDYQNGWNGWLLQHCGVYSVIRGKADRESFKTTREILAKNKNRLVIFIEGEISSENDTLIPFEPGVLQLAFWGLEDAIKQEKSAPPLYVVPVAIKYFYEPGVDSVVKIALDKLEAATQTPRDSDNTYLRIRALGQKILATHEHHLNMKPIPDESINQRADRVRNRILLQMEQFLALTPDPQVSFLDRVRVIRNHIDSLIYTYQDVEDLSDYEQTMIEHQQQIFQGFYDDLTRLINFMTFEEGRVIQGSMTLEDSVMKNPERFMELIHRLEKEVFGKIVTKHPKTAMVQLGDFTNLAELYPNYQGDKKSTVKALALSLESNMDQLLKSAQRP